MRRIRATRNLFINYLLRPEVAARNSNLDQVRQRRSGIPAASATSRCCDDPGIYPPPAVLRTLVPERAKSMQFTRLLTRMWTRFKTGK